jgi:tetratricopeptide (TPR) repeat protein
LLGQGVLAFEQSAEELARRGLEALKANQYSAAEKYFSALTEQFPSAAAFSNLAMSDAAQGKFEQAIAHFRRSIELGDRSAAVHYNLGLAYLGQGGTEN